MLWLTVAFVTDSVCNGVALFLFELVALDLFDETSMSTSDISVSSEQKSTLLGDRLPHYNAGFSNIPDESPLNRVSLSSSAMKGV